MTRKHDQIALPDPVADQPVPLGRMLASLAGIDLAAEAAAQEAGQVSALLASRALSLTNLTPDAMPRLLHRP